MVDSKTQPRLTELGVTFTVEVLGKEHECLISKATLDWLAARGAVDTTDTDEIEVFLAFERSIHSAAYKIIRSNQSADVYILHENDLTKYSGRDSR